ncbi:conserved Plasmodium protein, unknown function [Plasmodium gallinaceum]|uniref:Uncharacterized protein n=1 Tax=Plasmodium gallinaceum TaxID=5849 RepID=A0A1J1GY95_PLAGA|nr:conserved Plasmodium protein, unknown function [Plasmodium gallinaceum]CRG97279.1 conserved Plasmodium protein, unknown function [Plasmodium gallinaceum]
MYSSQYYSYDTIYRPYYPGYVLYEIPQEKNIFCSLTEALCSGIGLIITSLASICVASTDLLIRSCDNRKNR